MPTIDELRLARAKAMDDVFGPVFGPPERAEKMKEGRQRLLDILNHSIESADAAMGVVSVPVDQIAEAVARGWCSPKNATKEMDVDLAAAITFQIVGLLAVSSLREKPDAP